MPVDHQHETVNIVVLDIEKVVHSVFFCQNFGLYSTNQIYKTYKTSLFLMRMILTPLMMRPQMKCITERNKIVPKYRNDHFMAASIQQQSDDRDPLHEIIKLSVLQCNMYNSLYLARL